MSSEAAVQTCRLTKRYGDITAVADLELDVRRGEVPGAGPIRLSGATGGARPPGIVDGPVGGGRRLRDLVAQAIGRALGVSYLGGILPADRCTRR